MKVISTDLMIFGHIYIHHVSFQEDFEVVSAVCLHFATAAYDRKPNNKAKNSTLLLETNNIFFYNPFCVHLTG